MLAAGAARVRARRRYRLLVAGVGAAGGGDGGAHHAEGGGGSCVGVRGADAAEGVAVFEEVSGAAAIVVGS